jgi:hypothetical protein
MGLRIIILACVALSMSLSWAHVPLVKQLLQSALADTEGPAPGPTDSAYLKLNDALDRLTPGEIEALLPTGMQCLKSAHPHPQAAGVTFLIAAMLTPGSAALLDPYMDDFDTILRDPANPTRQSIIAILETTTPSMSPKAIQLFLKHLEDKANTPLQTGGIEYGLLRAAPSNQSILHQVLNVAENRSEFDVKYPVLQAIGLSKIQLPEALDFIGNELEDPIGRSGAIVAASRLDRDVRARFAAQLSRIAQDPDLAPDIRGAAGAAINGH